MSQENQSYLRFSLEESVWFQKGQEVAELISISLDPNISIVENDQYVIIRGSLELTGEYKRFDEEGTEQEEDLSAPKFIHNVEERDGGICEFLHRFPVDITIPNNRIESVYDIDVTVDSFDCLLPERSCLKLEADLTISGLYGEQQNVPAVDEEQEPEHDETPAFSDNDGSFWGTSVQPEEEQELQPSYRFDDEKKTDEASFEEVTRPNFDSIFGKPAESPEQEQDHGQEQYQPFTAEAKKQPQVEDDETAPQNSFAPFEESSIQQQDYTKKAPEYTFNAQRHHHQHHHDESPQEFDYQAYESPFSEEDIEAVVQNEESSSSSSPEKKEPEKKKSLKKKKSMSISEFLGRKTESESQVKLKVCIVQQGETLDSLSERYDLSVQQILRVNHLEANQDVYEGQVLYIPEMSNQ